MNSNENPQKMKYTQSEVKGGLRSFQEEILIRWKRSSSVFIYVFNFIGSLKTEISVFLLAAADVPNWTLDKLTSWSKDILWTICALKSLKTTWLNVMWIQLPTASLVTNISGWVTLLAVAVV